MTHHHFLSKISHSILLMYINIMDHSIKLLCTYYINSEYKYIVSYISLLSKQLYDKSKREISIQLLSRKITTTDNCISLLPLCAITCHSENKAFYLMEYDFQINCWCLLCRNFSFSRKNINFLRISTRISSSNFILLVVVGFPFSFSTLLFFTFHIIIRFSIFKLVSQIAEEKGKR